MDRARFVETPIKSCSQTRGLPGLPPLPRAITEDPSELYQIVLRNSEHPPIMKGTSWTLAAPFKEQKYHRTPSESIANNYTPTASDLKIRSLPRPGLSRAQTQPAIIRKRAHSPPKRSPRSPPPTKLSPRNGINGTFTNGSLPMEGMSPPMQRRMPGMGPRAKTFVARGKPQNGPEPDMSWKTELPPSRPMTPVEQLDIILDSERKESKSLGDPNERDMERYHYYISKGIHKDMLAPQPRQMMSNVRARLSQKIKENPELEGMRRELVEEIDNDYDFSLRKSIVDYILKDTKKKKVPTATLR